MATILSCGACRYPITFRDIAPEVMAETEHTIVCPMCGAIYNVLIRMIRAPEEEGNEWNKEIVASAKHGPVSINWRGRGRV